MSELVKEITDENFDENKFSLFNGICYAYSDEPELLVKMVNDGEVDKKNYLKIAEIIIIMEI